MTYHVTWAGATWGCTSPFISWTGRRGVKEKIWQEGKFRNVTWWGLTRIFGSGLSFVTCQYYISLTLSLTTTKRPQSFHECIAISIAFLWGPWPKCLVLYSNNSQVQSKFITQFRVTVIESSTIIITTFNRIYRFCSRTKESYHSIKNKHSTITYVFFLVFFGFKLLSILMSSLYSWNAFHYHQWYRSTVQIGGQWHDYKRWRRWNCVLFGLPCPSTTTSLCGGSKCLCEEVTKGSSFQGRGLNVALLPYSHFNSLTVEFCPGREGPILFGDDENGYVMSYIFKLRDSQARGKTRHYAFTMLMTDRVFLVSCWPFLVK